MENNLYMEEFRTIPGFENYKISNNGVLFNLKKNKIVNGFIDKNGYSRYHISNGKKTKCTGVHVFVAMAFLGHKISGNTIVVDHINNDKTDNRVENLQLITNRENASKDKKGYSSIYVGVSFYKSRNKWKAGITINNKVKSLGYHRCETKAHLAYQKELKSLLLQK